jgi:hypothetical protein
MSQVPDRLRQRAAELAAREPLEQVRSLLRAHFADADSFAEAAADLRGLAAVNTRSLWRNLAALDAVLAAPPADGSLATVVAVDGNWVLDDPTDAGAATFLREVADLHRQILGPAEPPPDLTA